MPHHCITMSDNVKNNAHLLKILSNCKPKMRKAILEHASPSLLKSLCECSLNVLNGNVRLTTHQKRKLSRHKRKLRALADRKIAVRHKKSMLVQEGGFIGALIQPILATLAGLLLK